MSPFVPSIPVMLPSRKHLEHEALRAAESGAPLIVLGRSGSGRTAFAGRILLARAQRGNPVYRLTGAHALRCVPFAALAAVVAQLPGVTLRADTPAHLLATLAHIAATQRPTILLDNAEEIDVQSAAVFAQLADSGVLSLVCIARSVAALPAPVRRLAVSSGAHRVELADIGLEDAVVLLEDFLGGRVNASAASFLLGYAGGNPLHLRELAFDAKAHGSLAVREGYWTLSPGWRPRGERIAELIATRLSEQPAELREAVEILALTGELPLDFASMLLAPEVLDRAHDAGLVDMVGGSGPVPRVSLGSALTPHTVLATLGRSTLRAHSTRIRATLPRADMHPHTRLALALHSQDLDVVASPEELLLDAVVACRARQFESVIVLTRMVDDANFAQWSDETARTELALLRAEALHEAGRVDDAMKVLAAVPARGDDRVRMSAAWVEFSGRGNLPGALTRLAAHEDDSAQVQAFARLLLLVGNQPCDIQALALDAANPALPADLRLRIRSQVLAESNYRGTPSDALAEIGQVLDGELWQAASPSARGELLHALHLAGIYDSIHQPALTAINARLDWDTLAVDHATFVVAQACTALECGDAAVAADLTGQARAMVDAADPHRLRGLIAAYQAVAAVMLGDRDQAAESYALFQSSAVTSGHALRADAQRSLLSVELFLHGRDAATAYCDRLVEDARARGRQLLVMRLLHDAWRLGLHDSATSITEAAVGMQGALARSLLRYAQVLGPAEEGAEAACVEEVVAEHVGTGRALYAAELANRAATLARDAGHRARASALLGLSADLARPLVGVNTPSLGRIRIQPAVLTEREREVCARAARGDSNVSIAEELFLSPRTVEGHLQRAYAKLGVSDRRQLLPIE